MKGKLEFDSLDDLVQLSPDDEDLLSSAIGDKVNEWCEKNDADINSINYNVSFKITVNITADKL